MSNCDDIVTVKETLPETSSIQVLGYEGDDRIVLGDESAPLDTLIKVDNIIVDGGQGKTDVLWIYNKEDEAKTISYLATENIDWSITTDEIGKENPSITVDFGQGPCISGKTVALSEGRIFTFGYDEAIQLGPQYRDITLKTTDCDDQITVTRTYPDALSLEVFGYGGNDRIVLGDGSRPLDTLIFGNITFDGGVGSGDVLKIHDEGSLTNKSIAMQSSVLSGIRNGTISYVGFESIYVHLGNADTEVNVVSAGQGASLTLTTQDGDDSIIVQDGEKMTTRGIL